MRAFTPPDAGSLVAIGNFDGVHIGHQAVLSGAVKEAATRGLAPLVLTFHPHPSVVLGRGARPMLTSIERKVELIARVGDALAVVIEPFTKELAAHTPRQFVEDLLARQLGAKLVIVGQNFRFGNRRAGDLDTLRELGGELGFEARAEPLVGDDAGAFSSTRVRDALARGDLSTVERLLGRPHSLCGVVIVGDRRGRALGFPTANLGDVPEALPPHGVYVCAVDRVDAGGASRLAGGVANIGVRPTVAAGAAIEVHLFDFEGDLYGERLRMHLLRRLRAEKKFSGLDELKTQIERDCAEARGHLEGLALDPAAAPGSF